VLEDTALVLFKGKDFARTGPKAFLGGLDASRGIFVSQGLEDSASFVFITGEFDLGAFEADLHAESEAGVVADEENLGLHWIG
jgi:hypothetical protein